MVETALNVDLGHCRARRCELRCAACGTQWKYIAEIQYIRLHTLETALNVELGASAVVVLDGENGVGRVVVLNREGREYTVGGAGIHGVDGGTRSG